MGATEHGLFRRVLAPGSHLILSGLSFLNICKIQVLDGKKFSPISSPW